MKFILIILLGVLMISCNQNNIEKPSTITESDTVDQNLANFDWLRGNWKRINETGGKQTFENWDQSGESEYKGKGYTQKNGVTISTEHMKLVKSGDNWDLIVSLSEDAKPVIFKGISHNANEFVCENLENEFPKHIKYWKNGDRLNAMIYSPEMEVLFEFERIN